MQSANFFEITDKFLEVTMALKAEDADRLFKRLREEKVAVFHIKAPMEFGTTGGHLEKPTFSAIPVS